MAYIGNNITVSNIQQLETLTFDSLTTSFSMRVAGNVVSVATSASLIVSVGGVIKEPNIDYFVSGSNLIFTVAPPTGARFFGIVLGSSINIGEPSDASVTSNKINGTISIAKGGTGASTADDALTNLGVTAVGKGLLSASSQAVARTQLGATAVGNTLFSAADTAAARGALGLGTASAINAGANGAELIASSNAAGSRIIIGAMPGSATNWSIEEVSGSLLFKVSGVAKFKMSSDGTFSALTDVVINPGEGF